MPSTKKPRPERTISEKTYNLEPAFMTKNLKEHLDSAGLKPKLVALEIDETLVAWNPAKKRFELQSPEFWKKQIMQTRAADKLNGTLTIWTIVTSRMNAGGITETFTDESRRERPEITEIKAVFEGLINMHCLTTAGEQIYGSPGATYCDRLKFIDAMKSRLNIDSPSDVLVFEPNGYVVDIAIKRYGYQAVHCTEKTFTEAKISKAIERFSPAPLIAIVDIPAEEQIKREGHMTPRITPPTSSTALCLEMDLEVGEMKAIEPPAAGRGDAFMDVQRTTTKRKASPPSLDTTSLPGYRTPT